MHKHNPVHWRVNVSQTNCIHRPAFHQVSSRPTYVLLTYLHLEIVRTSNELHLLVISNRFLGSGGAARLSPSKPESINSPGRCKSCQRNTKIDSALSLFLSVCPSVCLSVCDWHNSSLHVARALSTTRNSRHRSTHKSRRRCA